MIERNEEGKFVKGAASPNPGGRPKIPAELRTRLQNLCPKAIDALEQCLDSKDPKVRIVAAREILDRSYGRVAAAAAITLVDHAARVLDNVKDVDVIHFKSNKWPDGGAESPEQ